MTEEEDLGKWSFLDEVLTVLKTRFTLELCFSLPEIKLHFLIQPRKTGLPYH